MVVTAAAERDLAGLWAAVSTAVEAREALADVLPSLIERYGLAAGTMAAAWYDDLRAKQGIAGSFLAEPVEIGSVGADELARWGVGPLFAAEPDWATARSLIEGGMQRRILNGARETVTGAAIADPQADGWQRQTAGGCSFCQMLAGRGAVYSESGADFASHDRCRCVAVPAFTGQPRPVKPFTPSDRVASDADRARVRAWIASH